MRAGNRLPIWKDLRSFSLKEELSHFKGKKVLKVSGNTKQYKENLFLDQSLFAGSGNIVKNEVLFNIRRHPLTKLSDIDLKDRKKLVHAIRSYCENFYKWKKKFELRKHWQVYKQWYCKNCGRKLMREKMGRGQRSTFYCPFCQRKKLARERLTVHKVLPVESDGPKENRFDH